jgi:hypothetical protein
VIQEPFGNRPNRGGIAPDELVVGATKVDSTSRRCMMPITSSFVTYPHLILVQLIGDNDFGFLARAEAVAQFVSERRDSPKPRNRKVRRQTLRMKNVTMVNVYRSCLGDDLRDHRQRLEQKRHDGT